MKKYFFIMSEFSIMDHADNVKVVDNNKQNSDEKLNKESVELPTVYQQYIHLSRYARWDESKGRRETWGETVSRYFNFMTEHLKEQCNYDLPLSVRSELEDAVLNLKVMPSMRCLMTAGPALKNDNIAGYNCSYVAMNHPHVFDEIMYILMNGVGVGFSVERQYISLLPIIPDKITSSDTVIHVADSKEGWATAFRELIALLYSGKSPKFDVTKVRPKGSRLKTFGGRSSGPEPLLELFEFTTCIFKEAVGRKLCSIEVHDIVCKIASIVVCGGVRRSALISFSNLSDQRMQQAKSGQWWIDNPQRSLANNSVCYTEKPELTIFLKEWLSLIESKSGERGIFNRVAAQNNCKKYGRRNPTEDFGSNPCVEVNLRQCQFCNLSEIVIRTDDTIETLKEKVRIATILGTFQSTLINFKYINSRWRKNCVDEAILGVSMTGIMDNLLMSGKLGETPLKNCLNELREYALMINSEWADKLNWTKSVAITCVKPSGTVSQLVNSASGLHPRHSKYYIRTVRSNKTDPICQFLIDRGVYHEQDCSNSEAYVFSFPIKSPDDSILRDDVLAIEHLKIWKIYQDEWCEHKPSITVTVRNSEWITVADFVYKNFDMISGISFLPHSDHIYKQAPYQECTEEIYKLFKERTPESLNWNDLAKLEKEDNTTGMQELACSSNGCEI